MRRRRFVTGALASGALAVMSAASSELWGMGRVPLGGTLKLRVPWSLGSVDPHDVGDITAGLFAAAFADPLFALDAKGTPYPALADEAPKREGGSVVVRLREGLRTARGRSLDNRDVVFALERARARGGASVLAGLPEPRRQAGDALAVLFDKASPLEVARALASPLTAIVPRSFSSTAPDGTGAFRAELAGGRLTLARNPNAARGPAFLDRIEVQRAETLIDSLRSFEAARDDIGWLGAGLHANRAGSSKFDLGTLGWVVLAVGADGGSHRSPGGAQRLADALPAARLAHLGLADLPRGAGDAAWSGPSCELLVDAAAPQLVETARAVASILSRPDHEVEARPVSRAELARRRASGSATLVVDAVRSIGRDGRDAALALASAESPAKAREVGRAPPKVSATSPARALTAKLHLGVVGELRFSGAVVAGVSLRTDPSAGSWDLGASSRRR